MRPIPAIALAWLAILAAATVKSAPATPPISSAHSLPPPGAGEPREDPRGCLLAGNGFLRARIRGAVNLDIDWHNAEMQCDGGARPNHSGMRVSFAGPKTSDGRRLRMVFGIGTAAEGRAARALPTNLTVIFEGERRLFATQGEDKCTVDQLTQERVGDLGAPGRTYRIVAHGFCISPASSLDQSARILITSFDFAGRVSFES